MTYCYFNLNLNMSFKYDSEYNIFSKADVIIKHLNFYYYIYLSFFFYLDRVICHLF